MRFLLLPLVGPMQSWGTRSRFQERDTEREPTKSGVVGILCAAMGRDRNETLEDFAETDIGVRVDREGVLKKEYQTAEGVALAEGGVSSDPQTSNRYWLADAAFLVALQGPEELLSKVHQALANPRWSLFLGRKSYTPSVPLFMPYGLIEADSFEEALCSRPLLAKPLQGEERVRLVLPDDDGSGEVRMDDPMCFAFGRRAFRLRNVRTEFVAQDRFPKEASL